MSRPTYQDGDLWRDLDANASIRPHITENDEPGGMPLILDTELSNNASQIKARFYGWYDRVKLTAATGLSLTHTGAPVLLPSGVMFALSPGSINLPDNTSVFVYIDTAGTVTSATTAPFEWIPLAFVTTAAGAIDNLIDLRDKLVEQVRPRTMPPQPIFWSPGDLKPTFRTTPESGWLFCQGQSLAVADYPGLFAAIGYSQGGSGAFFSLRDLRGVGVIGAGQGLGLTNRPLGSIGGKESVALAIAQMPSHAHGVADSGHAHAVNDLGHIHGLTQSPHGHGVSESPHSHPVNDPGHSHPVGNYKGAALNGSSDDGSGAELSAQGTGANLQTNKETTKVTIGSSTTGLAIAGANAAISVDVARSNLSLNGATTGISVAANGGGAAHENMQPWCAANWAIKL